MVRLYLTDEQANSVRRALSCQITTLHKCAEEMHNDNAYNIEKKYINESSILNDVVAILDYTMRK